MTIVTRTGKGSALTQAELDGNWTDLDGRVTSAIASAATANSTATGAASTASGAASTATTAAADLATHAASTSAHGIPALQSAISANAAAIAALTLNSVTFTSSLPFTGQSDLGIHAVTGALAFSPNTTGAVRNGYVQATIVADGVHLPTVSGMLAFKSSGYVNTAGVVNQLAAFYDGIFFYYSWSQDDALTPYVAPAAPAFTTTPTIIGTPAVGVASAYTSGTVTGNPAPTITQQWTLDGVDIGGATGATYTPTTGQDTHALRVREIATNGVGSPASSTSSPVTIAAADTTPPTITARSVANATPTHIDLVFSEAMQTGSGATPAAGDFAVAGGSHTPSAFAWVDSTHATLTVPAFVPSETTTLAYTGGTNKLKDLAGNLLANFSGASITDNVSVPAIRLAVLNAGGNIDFESGDGTAGYNYAGTTSGGFSTDVCNTANVSLAASTDGEFQWGVGTTHVDTRTPMGRLATTNTQGAFAGCLYYMDCGGASGAIRTFKSGTLRTTGVAATDNDRLKFKRAGTTVTWERSTDGGSTWTVLDTATGEGTLQLFPSMCFLDTAVAHNLRGVGFT